LDAHRAGIGGVEAFDVVLDAATGGCLLPLRESLVEEGRQRTIRALPGGDLLEPTAQALFQTMIWTEVSLLGCPGLAVNLIEGEI